MLESYDVELASSRDTRQYRDKGKRKMDGVWLNMQDEHHKKMKKPSFLGAFAALNVSTIFCICIVNISPSVYLSIVSASQKAMELYRYLNNNREGPLPYNKRGITIPEPQEGILYKGMGIARLFAPLTGQRILRCFIRSVIGYCHGGFVAVLLSGASDRRGVQSCSDR